MALKDYYHLLHVPAGATVLEIKKAFRKLAMEYHPDKHENNKEYTSLFREIQEAYAVLSDPQKREVYHYQRWLEKSMGHELDTALDADQILLLFIKTEQYLATVDWYRSGNDALLTPLLELFSESRIATIKRGGNDKVGRTVLEVALRCSSRLSSRGIAAIMDQLKDLLDRYPEEETLWQTFIEKTKRKERIAVAKVPLIILVTLALCLVFFLLTRQKI